MTDYMWEVCSVSCQSNKPACRVTTPKYDRPPSNYINVTFPGPRGEKHETLNEDMLKWIKEYLNQLIRGQEKRSRHWESDSIAVFVSLTGKLISSSRTLSPTTYRTQMSEVRITPLSKFHNHEWIRNVEEVQLLWIFTWQKSWWLSSDTSSKQQHCEWVCCCSWKRKTGECQCWGIIVKTSLRKIEKWRWDFKKNQWNITADRFGAKKSY